MNIKKQLPPQAAIAIVAVVAILIVSVGWYIINSDTAVIHNGPDITGKVHLPQSLSLSGGGGRNATVKAMVAKPSARQ